jgi:hypothetical protein
MRTENDWRLTNQLSYFNGSKLVWRRYVPHSTTWKHDHCEFCWATFMNDESPEVLIEGWCTPNEYRWVCPTCFEDFADLFEWVVEIK